MKYFALSFSLSSLLGMFICYKEPFANIFGIVSIVLAILYAGSNIADAIKSKK